MFPFAVHCGIGAKIMANFSTTPIQNCMLKNVRSTATVSYPSAALPSVQHKKPATIQTILEYTDTDIHTHYSIQTKPYLLVYTVYGAQHRASDVFEHCEAPSIRYFENVNSLTGVHEI